MIESLPQQQVTDIKGKGEHFAVASFDCGGEKGQTVLFQLTEKCRLIR